MDDFSKRLRAAGLVRYESALKALARPSVRLVAGGSPTKDRGSRLGGLPDLPPSTPWPLNDDEPLSFIAQVDLADVTAQDTQALLPPDGLLSFFYAAISQEAWGFDPADNGSAVVLYTPSGVDTVPADPPVGLAGDGVFKPVALRPEAELTVAPWESYDVEQLGMSRDEAFAYSELFWEGDEVIHRLLGHPDPVQGDMQLECQLVTNGLNCGDSTGYNDPRAQALQAGASQWRLLMQVDSQEQAGMMWGDVGRLYYWVKDSDLAGRDWDQSWLILQCG
ncbi:MAG TPA: YwqG family protein [Propionicimonas sp.]|jgi:uncharacterized protein YwqG|nr:DUF1963 domain-containing protein [Dermatophilaceae bacterium]MBU9943061.1 DUF1963 domain-containing protein [Dermatophilaceae bacterium]HRA07859.1 YwqG family protein [Propionicimonas sp.]